MEQQCVCGRRIPPGAASEWACSEPCQSAWQMHANDPSYPHPRDIRARADARVADTALPPGPSRLGSSRRTEEFRYEFLGGSMDGRWYRADGVREVYVEHLVGQAQRWDAGDCLVPVAPSPRRLVERYRPLRYAVRRPREVVTLYVHDQAEHVVWRGMRLDVPSWA